MQTAAKNSKEREKYKWDDAISLLFWKAESESEAETKAMEMEEEERADGGNGKR